MEPTIPTLCALFTQRASDDLSELLRSVPDERLDWKANAATRTVMELIQECAILNQAWALLLTRRGIAVGDEESPELLAFVGAMQNTREHCDVALRDSTAALVQAIRAVPAEETGDRININRFKPETMTLGEACLYPYWNMVYHEGQINLLQLLYGDTHHYHDYPVSTTQGRSAPEA